MLRMDFESASDLLALLLNTSERLARPLVPRQDIASVGPLPGETAPETRQSQGKGNMTGVEVVERFFGRIANRAQQVMCGLQGHDALLHFGEGHISLLCTSCGHETPGWNVEGSPLARRSTITMTARPATRVTSRVVRMPAAPERRVA